jgi:hypothetical protein
MGALHEDVCKFMITSHSILRTIINISNRFVGKIKTHILRKTVFSGDCAVYEIMWRNTVQPDRPQMTI